MQHYWFSYFKEVKAKISSLGQKLLNKHILGSLKRDPLPMICNPQLFVSSTGSQDAHPSRYSATVRVQAHRVEMIQELSAMVKEHLMMFYKSTGGFKPHRVIMYRDGVSEGQFSAVSEKAPLVPPGTSRTNVHSAAWALRLGAAKASLLLAPPTEYCIDVRSAGGTVPNFLAHMALRRAA